MLVRLSSGETDLPCADPASELPNEEFELARRIVLFVWTSATFVGVVGRALSAAAAAAADKEVDEARCPRKACAAAVVAEGLTLATLLYTWVKDRC